MSARPALAALMLCAFVGLGHAAAPDMDEVIEKRRPGEMFDKKGSVLFKPETMFETNAAVPQKLDFGDSLRTLALSRAWVLVQGESSFNMDEFTRLEISRRARDTNAPGYSVIGEKVRLGRRAQDTDMPVYRVTAGKALFSSRSPSSTVPIQTPHVRGVPKGTEFLVDVDEAAHRTVVTMFDGEVDLSDGQTIATVRSGEQGIAIAGEGLRVRPIWEATNIVQWWIYYPGVIDADELAFPPGERAALENSLKAYRDGDLLSALQTYPGYPTPATPASNAGKTYLAALFLSVGAVDKAEMQLIQADSNAPPVRALRTTIGAVARPLVAHGSKPDQPGSRLPAQNPDLPRSASELLALSYAHQSTNDLKAALDAARAATERSPGFGFAWARVAELEFSFGRIGPARRAVERALQLSPKNAQAHAMRGFLLAGQNHLQEAIVAFDTAIALDSALGNAWLGRGLCKRRMGWFGRGGQGWLADLKRAAAVEPRRSLLRSYVGKAFADASNKRLARKELDYARDLDPNDPTPWLYSALLHHEEYRTAEAIHDLEKSQQLNDNRAVYRSRLLLDQDQAVRSANLANIFEDADMRDASVRESARAVSFDYANYSAHLNLASSFNQSRDPTRFNLRYETEWFNEHLLASLLAPVGAGSLSQNLSQQEYSQLFAGKRLGLHGTTEYFSTGEWRQLASQFGTLGNTSYALDLDYQHKDGVRINNDLERIEWYSRIKQQLGPQDSLLALVKYQDYESGDNFQYYDPDASARPDFRLEETQTPMLLGGWHHEWSPGVHTLFLGGRLVNDQDARDSGTDQLAAIVNPSGLFDPTNVVPFDVDYHSEFETYTAELNQIYQRARHTDILGARYQDGTFEADASLDNPPAALAGLFDLPEYSVTDADFRRLSLYAYHHWEIVDGLMLIGGVAYDNMDYPANFRRPSLESTESHLDSWSPKGAVIWDLTQRLRVRGMFSQAIGGVSYDESVRLEPTQLAGFSQSFRTVISESLVGSVEAPEYQVAGGALDLRPGTNTWLSLQVQAIQEEVTRDFGIQNLDFFSSPVGTPVNTVQHLDYDEWHARAVLNQMLGQEWFLEAQYQFTHSELEQELPSIAATPTFDRTTMSRANLHEGRLAALWRSPTGFFARAELWWLAQELGGDDPQPPGDSFPQVNLYAGYRFPKRRAELTLGGLNLTDQDYNLSPLNYYLELPRERLFYLRFRFNF